MMKVKNEDRAVYVVSDTEKEDNIIAEAIAILKLRIKDVGDTFSNPKDVKKYFVLKYAEAEHEIFSVMYLDSQNRFIAHDDLFRGTLSECSVYPREVVKEALRYNAAGIVFCHNHPSGFCEASNADIRLTGNLKKALGLVDTRVLDHIIVGGVSTLSLAEKGLI